MKLEANEREDTGQEMMVEMPDGGLRDGGKRWIQVHLWQDQTCVEEHENNCGALIDASKVSSSSHMSLDPQDLPVNLPLTAVPLLVAQFCGV